MDWMKRNRAIVAIVAVLIVVLAFLFFRSPDQVETGGKKIAIVGTHQVSKGEYLNAIADNYQVQRATMIYVNEDYLSSAYEKICGALSSRTRNNPRRPGMFCNDRYRRPYANTLVPGMRLQIPASQAPEEIRKIVATATTGRVALVVDGTGSMGNDIAVVTSMYSAALADADRDLVGIWVYSDNQVRFIDPQGFVNFYQPSGGTENTHSALNAAAQSKPDTIVLVTDEPGDDWEWPRWWVPFDGMGLPPVVATCLEDQGGYSCGDNLKKLASETGGTYVAYRPR